MKKSIIIILALAICQAGTAQEIGRMTRIDQKIQLMDEQLDLSDSQEEQIKELLIEQTKQIRELRATEGNHRDQIKKIRQESELAIRAILTESQREVFDLRKEEKKKERKELKEKANSFGKEHLKPAIEAERSAFDSKLSEEEKSIIIETRQKLKQLRLELKGDEGQALSKAERRAKKQAILMRLDPIIENHSEELNQIEKRLEPLRDQQHAIMHPDRKKKQTKRKIGKNFKHKFLLMSV